MQYPSDKNIFFTTHITRMIITVFETQFVQQVFISIISLFILNSCVNFVNEKTNHIFNLKILLFSPFNTMEYHILILY